MPPPTSGQTPSGDRRIHPEDRRTVEAGIRAVMAAGGQFWSGEYRFRRADGSYADIFDRGFVIYDGARSRSA